MTSKGIIKFFADDELEKQIVKLIKSAKRSLDIVSPWIHDIRYVLNPIRDLVKKGVRVRVFTRYPYQWNHEEACDKLERFGAEIITVDKLHTKMIIKDKNELLNMSANLLWNSLKKNFETGILTTEPQTIKQAEKYLLELHEDGEEDYIQELATEIFDYFEGETIVLRDIEQVIETHREDILEALAILEEEGSMFSRTRWSKNGYRYRLFIFDHID